MHTRDDQTENRQGTPASLILFAIRLFLNLLALLTAQLLLILYTMKLIKQQEQQALPEGLAPALAISTLA